MAVENADWGAPKIHWRAFEARLRGLRTHGRQISPTHTPAPRRSSQTLALLPRQSSRGDPRLRLLYRTHADLSAPVLFLRNRAWPAPGSALQHHSSSDCRVGGATTA